MPVQVVMPQLGESVVEGTISKWLKAKGEHVEEYEPLLEINTDKVDSEIPSPASGTLLDILVAEGTTVSAGALLAWIGAPGERAEASPAPEQQSAVPQASRQAAPAGPAEAEQAGAEAAPAASGPPRGLGFISPVVAKIASEQGVDLAQVSGTGQGGRITKKDILAHIETRSAVPAQQPAAPLEAAPPSRVPASAPKAAEPSPVQPGEILPLTTVRRAIAEHMVHSKHISPHVTTVMEADLSNVVAHRAANKDSFARYGVNLTFTAYFVAAAVAALKAYPLVNSSWTDEGILIHRDINMGIATSLGEAGLIVPVICNADGLSLLGLARTVNDLANRARARQLKPEEVKGGTFTITNHGISGSLFATPIINQPQCGILGVGAIQKRVVVVGGTGSATDAGGVSDAIAIRPMVYLSLTFDHRILDGATADYFLARVVESLQNWTQS